MLDDKIVKLLNDAMKLPDVEKIINSQASVLDRFSPVFQPDSVASIDEDVFKQFLSFKNNKHWTTLERQKNRLCEDMDALRATLVNLVDENQPIDRRFDYATRLHGLGKGTITAILLVAYPGKYGVWNDTSEKGLYGSGLWPELDKGATNGEIYQVINSVLAKVAVELGTSLWTLDSLWWGALSELGDAPVIRRSKKKNNDVKFYDGKERSIWAIKNSVLTTVKNATGQSTQVTVKNKHLLMTESELESLIRTLLEQGKSRCAITELPFEFEGEGEDKNMWPSLDRIDSEKHYEKSNVQLVCRFINFWKQAMPDAEFRRLLNIVKNNP